MFRDDGAAVRALKKHLERTLTEVVLLHKTIPVQHTDGFYLLNTDGGVRNGRCAIAWVLSDPGDNVIACRSRGIELDATLGALVQRTEYAALLAGLRFAHRKQIENIRAYLDNQIVVDQVNGCVPVKHPELKVLHARVEAVRKAFSSSRVYWVPRERNAAADALVRRGLS